MFTIRIPKYLWGKAVLTTYCLINKMPTRVLKFETSLTSLMTTFFYIKIFIWLPFKVFVCIAFEHIHKEGRSKFNLKAEKYLFVSYSPNQKEYKWYNPLSKKFIISINVTFF